MLATAGVLRTNLEAMKMLFSVWVGGEKGRVWGIRWRENLTSCCRRNVALSRHARWYGRERHGVGGHRKESEDRQYAGRSFSWFDRLPV